MRLIHWFRRDLRLHDNTALAAAVADCGGDVVPLFVLDETLLHGRFASAARTRFLLESLQALDKALRQAGTRLIIRRGDPVQELLRLAKACNAQGVYWNRDYSPYATRRDQAVTTILREAGLRVESFKDCVIWEPDEVRTKEGKPYTVYTPYAKRWRQQLDSQNSPIQKLPQLRPLDSPPDSLALPTLDELGFVTDQTAIPGGEKRARSLLQHFIEQRITNYRTQRELPGVDGQSHLSAHLRLGTISARTCLHAARLRLEGEPDPDTRASIETWIGELAWRDFFIAILANFPHVLKGAFKSHFNALDWQGSAADLHAWQQGETGFPIVDAAMRQLNREAWMHNRARMIVASFLIKDLLVDWREGERYFMRQLVDGDPAANNGNWQWAASTGTDSQPWFRIFNPISQGQKFDPKGVYVRRYIPELAHVPNEYIHEPWKMPSALQKRLNITIGSHYPEPIVDHATQREKALAMYRAAVQRKKVKDGITEKEEE